MRGLVLLELVLLKLRPPELVFLKLAPLEVLDLTSGVPCRVTCSCAFTRRHKLRVKRWDPSRDTSGVECRVKCGCACTRTGTGGAECRVKRWDDSG